ncbi:hypothetical protein QE152_g7233 [Popillia japonica]|uniref:Uncharacterized protein n=1 Tax=Popillia japonica TaxID=7064 RepID=A0AAW1MFR2_POPJA
MEKLRTNGKIEDDPRLIANIWKDYYHEILNGKEEIHTNEPDDTLTEEEEIEVKCPTDDTLTEEEEITRLNAPRKQKYKKKLEAFGTIKPRVKMV